jgi:hypothetical protein
VAHGGARVRRHQSRVAQLAESVMRRVGAQVGFGSRGAQVRLNSYLCSGWVKPLA